MSFLVSFNGQFSPLIHPASNSGNRINPVQPSGDIRTVQEFKDALEQAEENKSNKKASSLISSYQKSEKSFAEQKKRFYARDIMSSPVKHITKNSPVAMAHELLKQFGFRHLPVVDERQIMCGMLSDRDILSAQQNNRCEEVMQKKVIVCEEQTSIHEIAIILLREKINALPVVNQQREVSGIVTLTDILKHVIDTTPFLGKM
jgi:acetoin utilization protein AcuB